MSFDDRRRGDTVDQKRRHLQSRADVRHVSADDSKLIAAETGDEVIRPDGRFDDLGHVHQQSVAQKVTKRIVHSLEAVEIDEHHHQKLSGRRGPRLSAAVIASASNTRFGNPVRTS